MGDLPVEGLNGVLEIPAKGVADLVNHRGSTRSVSAWVTFPAAFQILFFALVTHDLRSCFHLSVILSGAMRGAGGAKITIVL